MFNFLVRRSNRKKIVEMIEGLRLRRYGSTYKEFDQIRIVTTSGNSKCGAFSYLDTKTHCLGYKRYGNQMSAGGWDCEIDLDHVVSVERLLPSNPCYQHEDYWW